MILRCGALDAIDLQSLAQQLLTVACILEDALEDSPHPARVDPSCREDCTVAASPSTSTCPLWKQRGTVVRDDVDFFDQNDWLRVLPQCPLWHRTTLLQKTKDSLRRTKQPRHSDFPVLRRVQMQELHIQSFHDTVGRTFRLVRYDSRVRCDGA
jgi:hypothetical protein